MAANLKPAMSAVSKHPHAQAHVGFRTPPDTPPSSPMPVLKSASSDLQKTSQPLAMQEDVILLSGYLLVKWKVSGSSKRWGMIVKPRTMEHVAELFHKIAASSSQLQQTTGQSRGRGRRRGSVASVQESSEPWMTGSFPVDERGAPNVEDADVCHLLGQLTKAFSLLFFDI
ncbi:hypothetical protein HDU67_001161 [Dinochytrium kinnereticum]|nr:hypothetical protein HDU67_001161 [Dinochytrium kinnereticum]